jgi:hypothetical protein
VSINDEQLLGTFRTAGEQRISRCEDVEERDSLSNISNSGRQILQRCRTAEQLVGRFRSAGNIKNSSKCEQRGEHFEHRVKILFTIGNLDQF